MLYDVISLHDGDMGKTNVVKHTINALPIRQQPRRLPGVIEPASSPWSSPIVVLLGKKMVLPHC